MVIDPKIIIIYIYGFFEIVDVPFQSCPLQAYFVLHKLELFGYYLKVSLHTESELLRDTSSSGILQTFHIVFDTDRDIVQYKIAFLNEA